MKDYVMGIFGMIALMVFILIGVYFWTIGTAPLNLLNRNIERESIERSHQYRTTKRQEMLVLYRAYQEASGSGQKKAVLGQLCEASVDLPESEVPEYVLPTLRSCR